MRWALVLILLVAGLSGCGRSMSEQEYAGPFKTECERYFAKSKEIAANPLPDLKGLSKEERRRVVAKRMREDTLVFQALASDFKKLKPPAKMEKLHTAYQEFLDGQARLNEAYVAAIESGDREAARQKNEEFVAFLGSQMRLVLDEMEGLGTDTGNLKAELEQIIRDSKEG